MGGQGASAPTRHVPWTGAYHLEHVQARGSVCVCTCVHSWSHLWVHWEVTSKWTPKARASLCTYKWLTLMHPCTLPLMSV